MSDGLIFAAGVITLPALLALYDLALEAQRWLRRAIRRRRKAPANKLAYGLVAAIGKQKRLLSARLLHSWRLPGGRRYELILLKEGPNEPTQKFFWPREPEPLDDEPPTPTQHKGDQQATPEVDGG